MGTIKDITGQRFGKLVAIAPTDKRQGSNVIWSFVCDCGEVVEKTTTHLTRTSSCGCSNWRSLRKDISGNQYGRLTAIKLIGKRGKELVWLFKCSCGKEIELPISRVTSGNTLSCGCYRKTVARENNPKYKSLVGKSFGMLTVISEYSTNRRNVIWRCRCECGKEITASSIDLVNGVIRGCGCQDTKLYCVYKHVSPEGKVYIGITSKRPRIAWFSGNKYKNQYALHKAIEANGGFEKFIDCFEHFYLARDAEWIKTDGKISYEETNLFDKKTAETYKRKYIKAYKALEPEFGYNAASGGQEFFNYSSEVKSRQSKIHTGEDNRTDWKVYIHQNKTNKKIYIGITCQDALRRWSGGRGYVRRKNDRLAISHFANAIKKYGWDGFVHHIIAEKLILREASRLEKLLIDFYQSTDPNKGYNIAEGGQGASGVKQSKETRALLSKLAKQRITDTGIVNFKGQHHKEQTKALLSKMATERFRINGGTFTGRHHTTQSKEKISIKTSHPVTMYDKNGVKIKTFSSMSLAAESVGVNMSSISACVCNRSKTSAGYIWRTLDVVRLPEAEMPDLKYGLCKTIEQYTIEGEYVATYPSLKDAAAATGLNASSISASITHKNGAKQAGGYKWKYVKNNA